jgi:hypothetical protein
LMVHPGRMDRGILALDSKADENQLRRRVKEMALLADPSFQKACEAADMRRLPGEEFMRIFAA